MKLYKLMLHVCIRSCENCLWFLETHGLSQNQRESIFANSAQRCSRFFPSLSLFSIYRLLSPHCTFNLNEKPGAKNAKQRSQHSPCLLFDINFEPYRRRENTPLLRQLYQGEKRKAHTTLATLWRKNSPAAIKRGLTCIKRTYFNSRKMTRQWFAKKYILGAKNEYIFVFRESALFGH